MPIGKQTIILNLLNNHAEMYGLEMIAESDGLLKRGSIYVLLNRMEDAGLVKSKMKETPKGEQGPPRRVYEITGQGLRSLVEKRKQLSQISGFLGLGGTT